MNQITLKDRFELFKSFVVKHRSIIDALEKLYSDETGTIEEGLDFETQEQNKQQFALLDKLDDQLSALLGTLIGDFYEFDIVSNKKQRDALMLLIERHINLMVFA